MLSGWCHLTQRRTVVGCGVRVSPSMMKYSCAAYKKIPRRSGLSYHMQSFVCGAYSLSFPLSRLPCARVTVFFYRMYPSFLPPLPAFAASATILFAVSVSFLLMLASPFLSASFSLLSPLCSSSSESICAGSILPHLPRILHRRSTSDPLPLYPTLSPPTLLSRPPYSLPLAGAQPLFAEQSSARRHHPHPHPLAALHCRWLLRRPPPSSPQLSYDSLSSPASIDERPIPLFLGSLPCLAYQCP